MFPTWRIKFMKSSQLTSNSVVRDLKAFFSKSGWRQKCLLLPPLLNIVLKVPARAIRHTKKEIKSIQLERKKTLKLSLFTNNIILYIAKSQRIHQKNLEVELINKFTQVAEYNINIQNDLYFNSPAMENPEK